MINRKAVYVIKFPQNDWAKGISIGIDVHIYKGCLCYASGPDRGHMIKGNFGKYIDGGFTWISEGYAPGEWTVKELTIEAFKRRYFKELLDRTQAEAMAATIHTTEDLWEYYRKLNWVDIGVHPADEEY